MLRRGWGVALRGVTVHVEPRFTMAANALPGHDDSTARSCMTTRKYIVESIAEHP